MNGNIPNTRLKKRELDNAKQVLAKRSELTRQNGFEKSECDSELLSYYHPRTSTGMQIYTSYTAEELLDILITYMERHGHSPDWDQVHYVYKLYLTWRFNELSQAKEKARTRLKQLKLQAKWPADWPERVSPEPLYRWVEEKGRELTAEHRDNIEKICSTARETGVPPDLSSAEVQLLSKIYSYKKALELMNIPALNKLEQRFMTRYWRANRTK